MDCNNFQIPDVRVVTRNSAHCGIVCLHELLYSLRQCQRPGLYAPIKHHTSYLDPSSGAGATRSRIQTFSPCHSLRKEKLCRSFGGYNMTATPASLSSGSISRDVSWIEVYGLLCGGGIAFAPAVMFEQNTCPSKIALCIRRRCHANSAPYRFQGVQPGRSHLMSGSFEKHWLMVRATAAICCVSIFARLVKRFRLDDLYNDIPSFTRTSCICCRTTATIVFCVLYTHGGMSWRLFKCKRLCNCSSCVKA
jgi:hypothetical protein